MVRIRSYVQPAEGAVEHFTWQIETTGMYRLIDMEEVIRKAREDGVPDDATVQLGGPAAYMHWRRPA